MTGVKVTGTLSMRKTLNGANTCECVAMMVVMVVVVMVMGSNDDGNDGDGNGDDNHDIITVNDGWCRIFSL